MSFVRNGNFQFVAIIKYCFGMALVQCQVPLLCKESRNRLFSFATEIRNTQEELKDVEGFKAKLRKDTSYKGFGIVSFVLKEQNNNYFKMGVEV